VGKFPCSTVKFSLASNFASNDFVFVKVIFNLV
jgi:hypothetical protein